MRTPRGSSLHCERACGLWRHCPSCRRRRGAGGVSVLVELFASEARKEDRLVLNSLYELGRLIGAHSAGSLPHPGAAELLGLPAATHPGQFEESVTKLEEILNLALTASIMVDQ